MKLSWPPALAWRMRQQYLDPIGTESVEDVVRRLGAVAARTPAYAELAVRARRQRSKAGEVARAFTEGRIIKCWVMRGAMHLMTPEDGGAYLAIMAAKRQWELPSWQSFYGLTPADWGPFRNAAKEELADGPMTPQELGAAITARPKFRHLAFVFAGRWDTLLKPLFWQGIMSFGPSRDGSPTFQRLDHNPRWAGVPEPAEAGRRVVESYLRAYGPASVQNIRYWQNTGERNVRSWLASLGDRLAEVEIDGERRYVLREDLGELVGTPQRTLCASCRDSTSGPSVRGPPIATSSPPVGDSFLAARHTWWSLLVWCPGPGPSPRIRWRSTGSLRPAGFREERCQRRSSGWP